MQRTTVKHIKEMVKLVNCELPPNCKIKLGEGYGYMINGSGGVVHMAGLSAKEAYTYLDGMYTALRLRRNI